MTLLADIRAYLSRYVAFSNPDHATACALWLAMTYAWDKFDSVPYLVITSDTKRSGKTRLAELLMFAARKAKTLPAPTAAGVFRSVGKLKIGPTLFIDEAESLSGETAGALRSVLNAGYRRGQSVVRIEDKRAKSFNTYCPKCIILIGDPYDTLRDRSIVIRMVRAEAPARFVYGPAQAEGQEIGARLAAYMKEHLAEIETRFQEHAGLSWLPDRDAEIWTPLFALCEVM
jgi:hypothetical protein